ncbi:DUF3298 and DUF4163 domain-containing protein [Clostridium sp. AM58-1XD]|uniref:DUF3298 and DUF4163 domain-containing protein n=1 Tax=Clostridium sp. AM58-1XD TaxID=2292307 RepID=UPI000E552BF4|nr:DUF3298 and DUF4163 domain-containing protein [Clostridium sp. AM58-1XD]RGY97638.1 anti-sigma-V factor rsiV [Clostridium sp. AM58-1XD]
MNERESRKVVDAMKEQYDHTKVPKEAKDRIAAGIRQAREEMEGGSEMKNGKNNNRKNREGGIIFMIKRTGMTAAAAVLAITVLTNVNPTIAQAMERIPVIGSISKVVTFRTYEDKTNNFEAKIDVPKVEGENNTDLEANKSIQEYADQLIAMYEADLKASEGKGNYALESVYDVVSDNNKYLSLRIRTTLIMASGTEFVKVFTIDKETGNVVTLKELLAGRENALEKIGENIKEQMREQMKADETVSYFLDTEMPELDFKGLTGDESYYFNKDGKMVITFDEYQVAPGYMGAVEFTIPESVTGEF